MACIHRLKNPADLAHEWPHHRGDPALQGLSNAALGNRISLQWEFKTGEFLKSSVVVSNGLAFVGSDLGCLACNQSSKWKREVELQD